MRRPGKKAPRLRRFGQLIVLIGSIAVLCAHVTGYLDVLSTTKLSTDAQAKLLSLIGDPGGTTYLAVFAATAAGFAPVTISGVIIFIWCVVHSVSVWRRARNYWRQVSSRRGEAKRPTNTTARGQPASRRKQPASKSARSAPHEQAPVPVGAATRKVGEFAYVDGAGI